MDRSAGWHALCRQGRAPRIRLPAAGFAYARGRFIITADGDLQNDPHDIPGMVEQCEQGPDIVAGWRRDRKDRFLNRRRP